MIANLEQAMKLVLAHEGGYSNHPADPGGATNLGVTQKVYDAYRQRKGQKLQSVRAIGTEEVNTIYKRQYWDAVKADDLPSGLDYAVFDYAVNSGPARAIKDLQRVVGVAVDGVVGNVTLAAIQQQDVFAIIDGLCERRMAFLRSLKTWKTFGRGWASRVADVAEAATAMAVGKVADVAPEPTQKAAPPERVSVMESGTVQGSAVQLASGLGGGIAAVGALDGTAQVVAIVLCGVVALTAAWLMRRRIMEWSEGVR